MLVCANLSRRFSVGTLVVSSRLTGICCDANVVVAHDNADQVAQEVVTSESSGFTNTLHECKDFVSLFGDLLCCQCAGPGAGSCEMGESRIIDCRNRMESQERWKILTGLRCDAGMVIPDDDADHLAQEVAVGAAVLDAGRGVCAGPRQVGRSRRRRRRPRAHQAAHKRLQTLLPGCEPAHNVSAAAGQTSVHEKEQSRPAASPSLVRLPTSAASLCRQAVDLQVTM